MLGEPRASLRTGSSVGSPVELGCGAGGWSSCRVAELGLRSPVGAGVRPVGVEAAEEDVGNLLLGLGQDEAVQLACAPLRDSVSISPSNLLGSSRLPLPLRCVGGVRGG